jgi:hypothetical protein
MGGGGSMGNNGALTLTTALPRTVGNCYTYLPAGAISTGSAAGWYWANFSSTTAATVYNNVYTTGQPTVTASPTAFSTTGPGAYTQTAGSSSQVPAVQVTVPAGVMGINGSLDVQTLASTSGTSGAKNILVNLGGTYFGNTTTTSSGVTTMGVQNTITNQGVANAQFSFDGGNTGDFGQAGAIQKIGAINTANAQTLSIYTEINASATDYVILERYSIKLFAN